jgi:hypothetical protein
MMATALFLCNGNGLAGGGEGASGAPHTDLWHLHSVQPRARECMLATSAARNLAKSPIALSLRRTEVQPLRQPQLLRACRLSNSVEADLTDLRFQRLKSQIRKKDTVVNPTVPMAADPKDPPPQTIQVSKGL